MYKRNKRDVRQVKQRRKDNTTDWRKRDKRNQGWENGSKAARKEWIGRPRLDRWKYERWKDERMKRRKGKAARQKWQKDKIKERTNMQTQHFIYSSDLADRITNCKLPAIQLHSDSNWRHPLFWCSARVNHQRYDRYPEQKGMCADSTEQYRNTQSAMSVLQYLHLLWTAHESCFTGALFQIALLRTLPF